MLEPFRYAFVQRGVVELLLLAICAGVVGSFVVLRGLAFFTHAVGTATFPGLVLADGIGVSAVLGAAASALVFAGGVERTSRRRVGYDSLTALVLVGALAGGVILASDVFHSGSNIETLLFGSLLVIGRQELLFAAAAGVAAVVLSVLLGRRWLALGFDGDYAHAVGLRSPLPDAALLVLIALSATVSVSAVGALLVTALFIVPAATVRLFTRRLVTLQVGTVAVAAVEGVVGIWLSVEWNVPPGAAIAVLAGSCFAVIAFLAALRRQRALLLPGFAVLALLAAGCGASGSGKSSGGVDVVATTTQIGDWARQVGGGAVSVHQLLQPNTDPHDYEPRPADVEATAGAKVVFENGDELDHWMGKVVSEAGGNPKVVVLGEHVPVKRPGESAGPEASRYDAHWWHDPRNAISAVEQIRNALVAADGTNAGEYRRHAATYLTRLRALDRGINACMKRVPVMERKLVTDHDAFGYFAARYGIEVVGAVIPSQTTQAQPSARDTARLIALIKREHVKAIFPESSINPRLAQTIARETGATARYTLYGDTLGPKGSAGPTYLSMEAANANAMVSGFSGGRLRCGLSVGG